MIASAAYTAGILFGITVLVVVTVGLMREERQAEPPTEVPSDDPDSVGSAPS